MYMNTSLLFTISVYTLGAVKCGAFIASPVQKNAFAPRASVQGTGRELFMSTKVIETEEEEKVVAKDSSSVTPTTEFGRPISDEMVDFNKATVGIIKTLLFDTFFSGEGRDYARFYALETIARMPYFAYLSVLHLYETLGLWRQKNYLKIHFAEEWNELHHLLIMEELGGNKNPFDRAISYFVSVPYFWIAYFTYIFNPTLAYNLNQAVEEHAFATYDQFLKENEEKLKSLPATAVAKEYYEDGDLYMFDEFQTGASVPRRPHCETLYDVFVNVRDDEAQHVKTMEFLQAGKELHNVHDTPSANLIE